MLQQAAAEYQAFWTVPLADPLLLAPRGQTDLANPILAALAWQPELIVVISDGWENDPPGAVAELLRVYYQKIDPQHRVSIVHCNPVFNTNDYELKQISPLVPTIGIREAEDLPTVLAFMRFADGRGSLNELETYLLQRTQDILAKI